MAKHYIDAVLLRSLLDYDPETGEFRWRGRTGRGRAGMIAGNVHKQRGYRHISINHKLYSAGILAWVYVNGEMPSGEIDHIDRVRHNNKISNLRDVPHRVNMQNISIEPLNNKLGLTGVRKVNLRYQAQIQVNRKNHHLGYFTTPQEAHAAYLHAKSVLHHETAFHEQPAGSDEKNPAEAGLDRGEAT